MTTHDDGIANDGNCTLREAVRAANLNVAVDACGAGDPAPAIDAILLVEPSSPYRLTAAGAGDELGDLDVFESLEIGGGPALIDAAGLGDRVFDLRGAAFLTLVQVHVRGGDAGPFRGGGIRVGAGATLRLFRSSVRGNRAAAGAGISAGGPGAVVALHDSEVSHNAGLHAIDLSSADLLLHDSTVAENAGAGVTASASTVTLSGSLVSGNSLTGLHAGGASIVTVRNSTVSGNGRLEPLGGGGLRIDAPAAASLYYSTVADNAAVLGGGVYVTGSMTLKGTILGANHALASHPDCWSETAQMTTLGWNLFHREDCEIVPVATDRLHVSPALDVLADWGGPTRSHRLLLGSPALDGGDPVDFPPRDQRGEPRPRHGDLDALSRPDVGAHENGNTIVVTTGADPSGAAGSCSLREAVRSANTDTALGGCRAGFERDLIWIDAAVAGVPGIHVAGLDEHAVEGDFDVRQDVDVAGMPHRRATVDGRSVDRVFDVHAPARLGLSHLDVRDGAAFLLAGGGLRVGAGAVAELLDVGFLSNEAVSRPGGGAYVAGRLSGEHVWFEDNVTNNSGGGIALDGPAALLRLSRARLTGNRAARDHGGALAVLAGEARLSDVTIAGNQAFGDGGGVWSEGTVELRNATIAYNVADADAAGGGAGGGIQASAGSARILSSIVAENLAATAPDCAGVLESGGHNVLGVESCVFAAAAGDQTGVAAGLGASIGGAYWLLPASPARDAGSPEPPGTLGGSCTPRDAMGTLRPADGDGDGIARCDAGALESHGAAVLDVDGNGSVAALTDGLLVLRYLLGATGSGLTSGAIGDGASRWTADAVLDYLTSIRTLLDVDGNGSMTGLTDGLLVVRYLFGLRDQALTSGALGAGATRTTSAQLGAYLHPLTN